MKSATSGRDWTDEEILAAWKAGELRVAEPVDELRGKLAGWHFAKESLTEGEREILLVAEALLRELDRIEGGYAH